MGINNIGFPIRAEDGLKCTYHDIVFTELIALFSSMPDTPLYI